MVTTIMPNVPVSKTRPGRRYDNLFISGMVSLLLGYRTLRPSLRQALPFTYSVGPRRRFCERDVLRAKP